jgi:hypothetical protein
MKEATMKRFIIGLLLAAFALPVLAINRTDQFNLNYWMYKQQQALAAGDSPTFAGLTLSGLTASTVVYSNASKAITSLANGSGVLTNNGSGTLAWSLTPTLTTLNLTNTGALTSTAGNITLTTSLTAATGNEVALSLNYTANKGSGNDTGLQIVQTDTSSPGTSYLINALVATTSKFSVTNAGYLTLANSIEMTGGRSIKTDGNQELSLQSLAYSATSAISAVTVYGTHSNTSGSHTTLTASPTYNQASGTADNTDLKINRTETAIGSGTQRLISGQVGGVEKWGVDNRGGMMVGLTPDAIMQVGMVAMADAGTDERYDVNGAGGTLPIGIVGGSGPTAAGTARALVVQGTCYVAPAEDVVAVTRGHVCFVDGSDAGYVDDNAALQAAGLNIGIYLNSEAAVTFDGAADVAADGTITLDSDQTAWAVGDPVIYWDSGDTAPAELTTGGVYWIQSKAGAAVKLAATRGGAAITLTDGSGTTMYLMRLPKCIIHWN